MRKRSHLSSYEYSRQRRLFLIFLKVSCMSSSCIVARPQHHLSLHQISLRWMYQLSQQVRHCLSRWHLHHVSQIQLVISRPRLCPDGGGNQVGSWRPEGGNGDGCLEGILRGGGGLEDGGGAVRGLGGGGRQVLVLRHHEDGGVDDDQGCGWQTQN